ncbi:MAG: hypothetical protein LBR28_06605 [Bacteroidales bacterium]|jgi:hypothetical protein|nr:hypothetical protein [Bacteroidales bacterium]
MKRKLIILSFGLLLASNVYAQWSFTVYIGISLYNGYYYNGGEMQWGSYQSPYYATKQECEIRRSSVTIGKTTHNSGNYYSDDGVFNVSIDQQTYCTPCTGQDLSVAAGSMDFNGNFQGKEFITTIAPENIYNWSSEFNDRMLAFGNVNKNDFQRAYDGIMDKDAVVMYVGNSGSPVYAKPSDLKVNMNYVQPTIQMQELGDKVESDKTLNGEGVLQTSTTSILKPIVEVLANESVNKIAEEIDQYLSDLKNDLYESLPDWAKAQEKYLEGMDSEAKNILEEVSKLVENYDYSQKSIEEAEHFLYNTKNNVMNIIKDCLETALKK